jgi:peptide/nickel transport system ATP-binding protein
MNKDILKINNLSIGTKVDTKLNLVDDISFSIKSGKTTCIVGESGSGKSLTALSIIRLLSPQLKMSGEILYNNEDICKMSELEIREKRGLDIAMIFQEPMTSLNPVLTIGYQIKEAIAVHSDLPNNEINNKVEELLMLVGIPVERVSSYPDELSGGQRQRVMIAMSMSCNPKLLIADEPTTALDVTVQAQILKLLDDLKSKLNMSMLFITHDFGVVEDIADDVIVMFKGKIVERGKVNQVLKKPNHPYTKALLGCVPDALGKKQLTPIDYEKLDRAIQRL